VLPGPPGHLPWSAPWGIVLILGGFFALTVGAVALRGLTAIDGGHTIQGFADLRDAVLQTAALAWACW
jgi:hypothetical protein